MRRRGEGIRKLSFWQMILVAMYIATINRGQNSHLNPVLRNFLKTNKQNPLEKDVGTEKSSLLAGNFTL